MKIPDICGDYGCSQRPLQGGIRAGHIRRQLQLRCISVGRDSVEPSTSNKLRLAELNLELVDPLGSVTSAFKQFNGSTELESLASHRRVGVALQRPTDSIIV
jgi:hypothetical protein